jgi:hypothetical protein
VRRKKVEVSNPIRSRGHNELLSSIKSNNQVWNQPRNKKIIVDRNNPHSELGLMIRPLSAIGFTPGFLPFIRPKVHDGRCMRMSTPSPIVRVILSFLPSIVSVELGIQTRRTNRLWTDSEALTGL